MKFLITEKEMNLQLSLKKKWFEMTKAGIKTEDYRELNDYWFERLIHNCSCLKNVEILKLSEKINNCSNGGFKNFSTNTMTLGYPKKGDTERILKLEHKGIEIRTGNPDWGAEPGKLYFVIQHGSIIE